MALQLQASDLEAPLKRALNQRNVRIGSWASTALAAGGSRLAGGLGVYRVHGTAMSDDIPLSWSLILKAMRAETGELSNSDSSAWSYWKREALAYQSGILAQLPGGIRAPRCYGVDERLDGSVHLWLEDVPSAGSDWPPQQYALVARHLGRFNGAYLAGHPLPALRSWMLPGRTRQWIDASDSIAQRAMRWRDTPLARSWFGRNGLTQTLNMLRRMRALLPAFERLPACYCHHDAHRRNLIDAIGADGQSETVAIDWALTGPGRLGEEIGASMIVALEFLDIPASRAHEFDQLTFAAYVDGLRDAGWRGDQRLARIGCAFNAVVITGLFWNLYFLERAQIVEGAEVLSNMIGRPFDEIVRQYAELLPFLLDLGSEAELLATVL